MYEMTEQHRTEQTASAESAAAADGVALAKDHYPADTHAAEWCAHV